MTVKQIEGITTKVYSENEWKPVISFFWNRYNKRYFDQIKELQKHTNTDIRNNCGFMIASIDCILIETLEQYYEGTDETKGATHDSFLRFFKRSAAIKDVIKNQREAGYFAGLIRSGLLHQSKTKKKSIINIKSETPILGWIDDVNKTLGFKLNRDKFHHAVLKEYENLIENLKLDENTALRKKFLDKIKTLVE